MQILPPRKPSFGAAFYANRRRRMPLEKPAVVAVDPAESAKRDELTAGHARSSPHVRGTGRDAHGRVAALGITPPRGTVDPGGDGQVVLGIIPACAGNSCHRWRAWSRARDHPRACGEQQSW